MSKHSTSREKSIKFIMSALDRAFASPNKVEQFGARMAHTLVVANQGDPERFTRGSLWPDKAIRAVVEIFVTVAPPKELARLVVIAAAQLRFVEFWDLEGGALITAGLDAVYNQRFAAYRSTAVAA